MGMIEDFAAYLQAKHLPEDHTPMTPDYAQYLIITYGSDEDRRKLIAPMIITDEELVAEVEQTIEFVKQLAARGNKEIKPLLKILHRKNISAPIAHTVVQTVLPEDRDLRDRVFYSLGRKYASGPKGMAVGIVYHCEAWMVLGETDVAPSKHPERVECVTVSGLTIDGRVCGVLYELRRRHGSHLVLVQNNTLPAAMEVTGIESDTGMRPLMLVPFFQGVLEATTKAR